MNNIIYDDEINPIENDTWDYYRKFTRKLNHRDCIKLSLFCAKYVNPNTKESNLCIKLVEKWLKDENSVSKQELRNAAYADDDVAAVYAFAAYATVYAYHANVNANAAVFACNVVSNVFKINKYLQVLLRKTKQFQNNKILEQISKVDVDKLELVDWNMITDIMQEEYNIIHEFEYEDIFSRRCLIELLRREYV